MFSQSLRIGRFGRLSRLSHLAVRLGVSLLFLHLFIFAQGEIPSEEKVMNDLVAVSDNDASIDRVIADNQTVITQSLWGKLISAASREYYSDPGKALRIYQIAIKVGRKLNDKRLLAITYYDLGLTY